MPWNFAPTLALALASLFSAGTALPDPTFDFQLASPQHGGAEPERYGFVERDALYQTTQARSTQHRMSANLHDVDVKTVLGALEKQGLSFVISDKDIKNDHITMSINNQPVEEVADAIAIALGGHWVRRGQVLVFKSGVENTLEFGLNEVPKDLSIPPASGLWNYPSLPNGVSPFMAPPSGKGGLTFPPPVAPSPNTPNPFGKSNGNGALGVPNGAWPDSKLGDILQKSQELKDWSLKLVQPSPEITLGRQDLHKFMESLTPREKDLQKRQGYIRFGDLTPDQQSMLGMTSDGKVGELTITMGDQKVAIRP